MEAATTEERQRANANQAAMQAVGNIKVPSQQPTFTYNHLQQLQQLQQLKKKGQLDPSQEQTHKTLLMQLQKLQKFQSQKFGAQLKKITYKDILYCNIVSPKVREKFEAKSTKAKPKPKA
jgi:hypothetical protein